MKSRITKRWLALCCLLSTWLNVNANVGEIVRIASDKDPAKTFVCEILKDPAGGSFGEIKIVDWEFDRESKPDLIFPETLAITTTSGSYKTTRHFILSSCEPKEGAIKKLVDAHINYIVFPKAIKANGYKYVFFPNGCFKGAVTVETADLTGWHSPKDSSIPAELFCDCPNLKTVKLDPSVTSIGEKAFYGSALQSLENIENTQITSVGKEAFANTQSGDFAFRAPSTLNTLGEGCFKNSHAVLVSLAKSNVSIIPDNAFRGCTASMITFPDGITTLGATAFLSADKVETLDFSKALFTSIPESCFEGTRSMTNIKLPSSLTTLGQKAFRYASALESIDLKNTKVTNVTAEAFNGCGALTDVKLNDKTEIIGSQAFKNCASLKSMELPGTLASVGDLAFRMDYGSKLEYLRFHGTAVIPTFAKYSFFKIPTTAKLYTPVDYGYLYKKNLKTTDAVITASLKAEDRVHETLTVGKNGYTTYFLNNENFEVPAGMMGFIITGVGSDKYIKTTRCEASSLIPAKTGFFLCSVNTDNSLAKKGSAYGADYRVAMTTGTEKSAVGSLMVGVGVETKGVEPQKKQFAEANTTYYILAMGSTGTKYADKYGFYYQQGTGGKSVNITPHKAALAVPNAMAAAAREALFFDFNMPGGSEPTGVKSLDIEAENTKPVIYDMQGRRVENPSKGIYIVNGKKVVIR